LNPTQLAILGPLLTPENVEDLVRRATHLTKAKTKELAVSIQPKQVPADGLRKLPAPVATPAPVSLRVTAPATDDPSVTCPAMAQTGSEPAAPAALTPPVAPVRPPPRSTIEPVAADRWQWRIGLNGESKAKLDKLRGYLGHKFADGDLDKLFAQMLDDSLEKHGKRLGFDEPKRPRKAAPPKAPTPGKRAPVRRADRRAVLKRDGNRCTWVTPEGERCPCTTRLEMDHLDPAAETGSSGAEDLTTRCRTHNQYRAFLMYGADHLRRRMEEDRRAREARRKAKANSDPETLCEPVALYGSFRGRSTVNVEPSPGALATRMVPPCASTRRFTIQSPRPRPE
jgi:hypothetical protein